MMIENISMVLNYIFAAAMPISNVVGYIASALSVALMWKYWGKIIDEPVFSWLLIFVVYGMLLVPFSGEPKAAFGTMVGYLSHWVVPFVLGYAVFDPAKARKALLIYFAVFSLVVALALLAYFGMFPKVVHGDFNLVRDGLLQAGRSHIALGSLCIFISFFLIGISVYSKDAGITRLIPLIPAAVYAFALVLTGSRSYYIAGFIVYISFAVIWAVKNGMAKYLLIFVFLLGAAGGIIYKYNPAVHYRFERTGLKDNNVSERLYLYKIALAEIKARPIFGFGPGLGIKQKQYFNSLPPEQATLGRHPALHLFYLNLTADFGLAGLAIFVIIMVHIFSRIVPVMLDKDSSVNVFAFGFFWGLAGLLIGDNFDTLLRGPGVAMEVFWVTGMILRVCRDESSKA